MKPNTKKQVTYSCSFAEMAQLFEDALDGCFTFDTVSYEDFIKFLKEHAPNIVLQFGARTPDFIKELERLRNIALQAEIAELVAALKPFGAIDLVESRLPAELAMLILRARAAIAKVRKP